MHPHIPKQLEYASPLCTGCSDICEIERAVSTSRYNEAYQYIIL